MKITKKMNSVLGVFLAFVMTFLTIGTPTLASGTNVNVPDAFAPLELEFVEANINSLVRLNHIDSMISSRGVSFSDKTINNVKQLVDFNGYTYYVVEFDPLGYIVYDNKFVNALEVNANADSPYLNLSGNLIFAGAGQYYVHSDTQPTNGDYSFTHTVLGTKVIVNDDGLLLLQEESRTMSEAVDGSAVATLLSANSSARTQTSPTRGFSYADLWNYTTITGLDTTDWNQNGNCGYVAAAIVVYYHYATKGCTQFVPGGVANAGLVQSIQGGMPDWSIGPEVAAALSTWSLTHGKPLMYGSSLGFPTAPEIFSLIAVDRPVIILGNIPYPVIDSNGNHIGFSGSGLHVITVTGVVRDQINIIHSNWYFWAHYGWGPNCNNIYVHDTVTLIQKTYAVYY